MSMKTFVFYGAALAWLPAAGGSSAWSQERNVVIDESTIATAGVAGFSGSGSEVTTRQPGAGALLYGIGGGERGDAPCYIELSWSTQTAAEHSLFDTKFWKPPCADEHHSYEWTKLTAPSPALGIGEIQVCTNNDEKQRLKGAKITLARDITETGNHDMPVVSAQGQLLRPHCDTWNHPSRCAANTVAIGVKIHSGDEGVTGLQLVCATAKLEATAPRPTVPMFTLDNTKTPPITGISGFAGTPVRVGPTPGVRFGLSGIDNSEQRDRPCFLRVKSDAVRESLVETWTSDMMRYDEADRCDDRTPGDAISVRAYTTNDFATTHDDELYQVYVSGVRICTNNDATRLKGVEIRARRILVQGDEVVVQSVALDETRRQDARGHCNDDNWRAWVDCPAAHIATAAVAHYEAGNEPRSITGLQLECRLVEAGY